MAYEARLSSAGPRIPELSPGTGPPSGGWAGRFGLAGGLAGSVPWHLRSRAFDVDLEGGQSFRESEVFEAGRDAVLAAGCQTLLDAMVRLASPD